MSGTDDDEGLTYEEMLEYDDQMYEGKGDYEYYSIDKEMVLMNWGLSGQYRNAEFSVFPDYLWSAGDYHFCYPYIDNPNPPIIISGFATEN